MLRDSRLGRWTRRHPGFHKVVHASWCRAFNYRPAIASSGSGGNGGGGFAVTLSADPNPAMVNEQVAFKPVVAGGAAPFSFYYDFGNGYHGSDGYFIYQAKGTYTVTVTVKDSNGKTAIGSMTEVVN